jgi:HAD superfamily hydrolase (TIGR01484 family)
MRPIASLTSIEARSLTGLLFDLDDTFLDGTRLSREAYGALFDLVDAGLSLVAVTGRPSGWGEVLARQWPVMGVVVENGALAYAWVDGRLERWDSVTPAERARRRERLQVIAARIQDRFPDLCPTDDARTRESDVTFDIGEYRRVEMDVVDQAMKEAMALGARVRKSSVHLHLTLDGHDKASGTVAFVHHRTGMDPGAARHCLAFIGDSENDSACFAAFDTTIAVGNFRARLTVMPRFVTIAARGAGFVEAARAIMARRL